MRILLCISILLWFPLKAQWQKPFYPFSKIFGSLTYEVIRNAPKDANNLAFIVVPLYIDLYKPNSDVSSGCELGLSYRTPDDKIFFDFRFRNAYYDRIYEEPFINPNIQIGYPVKGSDAAMGGTATLTYNFYSREVTREHYVLFKETYATRYYVVIPADLTRHVGFRLSADYYKGEYKFSKGISGNVIDKDTSATVTFNSNSPAFFTMMSSLSICFGISSSTVHDLKTIINYNGRELNRGVYGTSMFYFDVLFSPYMSIDNIYVPMNYNNGWYNYHLVDISATKKLPIGFRIGVQEYSTKGFGQTIGLEAGLRPGPVSDGLINNLYLTVKYGASISCRFLKKKNEQN